MRAVLAVAGLALLGYGISGWLDAPGEELLGRLMFLAAALAAHDGAVVPLVLVAGSLVTRFVPLPARRPAQAGLAVSAALGAVALPFVVGAGRIADNPSAFPQHYGRNLLLLLAVVWLAVAAWTARRIIRSRAASPPPDRDSE